MPRNPLEERLRQQAVDWHADSLGRPGREGQATVGHVFLSRAALTKANPLFVDTFVEGEPFVYTRYMAYGFSTYGGTTVYCAEW